MRQMSGLAASVQKQTSSQDDPLVRARRKLASLDPTRLGELENAVHSEVGQVVQAALRRQESAA